MSRLTKSVLFVSAAECEQAFYEALEGADADAVNELWLDDDDVCCVHPNGPRLLGYAAVAASWRTLLSNGPVHVRASARKTLETPAVTVHNVIEELVVSVGNVQQVVHVIATNAYVKTPTGWKMVLHHASRVPSGQAREVETPVGPLH
ncbi:MAG TPA: nuclear transport factor 2 family protein [Burkholderiaceae bacterium]|jgi:ketosteroid isomerase-like protein|nr:nuclear transport factor 2 family protein [Burkholderiaceae bacterium]